MEGCATKTIKHFASATQEMKRLTQSLAKQRIRHFSMIRSFDDGRFVNLSNIDGWIDYYYQKKLYQSSCFENHPSNYFSQVYLWHNRLSGDVIEDAKEQFNSSNGVTVIDRKYHYTSFYFFSSTEEEKHLDNFYINHLDFLYQFIHGFEKEATTLIANCISKTRRHLYEELYIKHTLPDNIEHIKMATYQNDYATKRSDQQHPNITPKEAECLSYLLKGKSTKEIANILNISPRTVEHHIGSLKKKFRCKSSINLISAIYDQHYYLALSLLHNRKVT